jgi:hypothetical protein
MTKLDNEIKDYAKNYIKDIEFDKSINVSTGFIYKGVMHYLYWDSKTQQFTLKYPKIKKDYKGQLLKTPAGIMADYKDIEYKEILL